MTIVIQICLGKALLEVTFELLWSDIVLLKDLWRLVVDDGKIDDRYRTISSIEMKLSPFRSKEEKAA